MTSRDIIIYLSIINKGNWDDIYKTLLKRDHETNEIPSDIIDENEAKRLLSDLKSKVITILDDNYPETLKSITKPPFCLFYHGDISLLDCKFKSVAVVGSRKFSDYGAKATNKIVSELAKEVVIISGMAAGIDSIAHISALNAKGKTIAVLGSGINYVYPKENQKLYDTIKKRGLVISEYYDKTIPNQTSFPWRNRIVAGLTNCVLVPEGKLRSGSQITAFMVANNAGYVCCVPTHIGEESLCNHLISEGARLVETAEDVFEEMGYQKRTPIFNSKIS